MLAYLFFGLTIAVAVYLWHRAQTGVTVPLSVWMIPVVLLTGTGAIYVGVGIDNPATASRAAASAERAEIFAATLAEVLADGRFFFLGTAALAAAETAMAGRAGERRASAVNLFGTSPPWVGCILAAALGAVSYWQLDPSRLPQLAATELLFVLPPLLVAGSGIGIGHTLQRKTPSSFPFAIGGVALAGLAAFYLGARLTRWEADCRALAGEPTNAMLIGPSSPNIPYDSVVTVATAAAALCVLALAILGTLLEEKPWKWGTLGDGILFLLVTIVFCSSLGSSWNALSARYLLLDRLAAGEQKMLHESPDRPPSSATPAPDTSPSTDGERP